MAIVADQTNTTGQQDINAPKAMSPGSGGGAGSGSTAAGAAAPKSAPGGYGGVAAGTGSGVGNFQNVSGILNANKNSNIAGGIVSGVQNQANQTEQGVNSTENSANQNIAQQWNQAAGTGNNLQQAEQNVQGIVSGAGANTTQQQVGQFQAAQGAQYNAPAANFSGAQTQLQNLQSAAQNTGNAQGQLALLQQYNKAPNYTSGEQQIDQALLANNRGEQNTLQGVGQAYAGAQANLNNAQNTVNQNSTQAATNIGQLSQAAQNALSGAVGSVQTGTGLIGTLNNQAAADAAANTTNYNNVVSALQANPGLVQAFVPSGQNIQQTLSQAAGPLTAEQTTPTAANILNAQQAAQVNALEQLGGASQSQLVGNLQSAFNPQTAGTTTPTAAVAGNYQAYNPSTSGQLGTYLQNFQTQGLPFWQAEAAAGVPAGQQGVAQTTQDIAALQQIINANTQT